MLGRRNGDGRLERSFDVLRYSGQIVQGLWAKCVLGRELPRRMGRLDLDAIVEQTPNCESRITLSDRTDVLGMPLTRIDWRIGHMERLTAIRLGHAVNAALARAGKPQAILADWVRDGRPEDAVFEDQAHPSGATRMSDSNLCGVVDRNGKVHGMDNLYISGSSVFPTAGHANPTLMIVALALRLSDWLQQQQVWQQQVIQLQSIPIKVGKEHLFDEAVMKQSLQK